MATAALVAGLPRAHDRQLPGNAGVFPGTILDHRALYLLQAAGRRGQCRGRHQCGRCDPGRFKTEVTYPPPSRGAPSRPGTGCTVDRPRRRARRRNSRRSGRSSPTRVSRRCSADKGVVITALDESGLVLVHAAGRLRPHAAADRRLRLDQPPRRGSGGGGLFGLGRSRAKRYSEAAAEGHLRRRRRASTRPRTSWSRSSTS